jgi:hypothetical protein
MRNKVHDILKVIGRDVPEPGAHMYHAADAVGKDGSFGKEKRHKIRKALVKLRLRASGMTDDILGSKETQGTMENPYEQAQKFNVGDTLKPN